MTDYRIEDDNGVIATYDDESEALAALDDPSTRETPVEGDLVLVQVLAIRR